MSAAPPLASPSVTALALALAEALLDAALQAQRTGALDELVRTHPRAARWLMRRHLRTVRGTAGDALAEPALPRIAALLLRWGVAQLRPDAAAGFDGIGDEAWLRLSSWRPALAMAAHAGLLPVPDFPRIYRRRPDEPALDNLCGLWGVGPSTVYRLLERGRQGLATLAVGALPDAAQRLSLRAAVLRDLQGRGLATDAAWHTRQAVDAQAAGDAVSALWHRWRAGDLPGFTETLRQRAGALAAEPETDALVERVAAGLLSPREQVLLALAGAVLARTRNAAERELRAYEQARQAAQTAQDPLLLGIVHSALGKYYEARDADRAFACYQDSAEFLRDLGLEQGDAQALEHVLTTYARLAWLYLLRNDARSRALLDRAEALRAAHRVPDEVLGMLEQVWGEYWRRSGELPRALEHLYRALNIFERLGDQRSLLATQLNMLQIHGERREHARALACAQRIFQAARRGPVEPTLLASTHLNLGATHFWAGELGDAIAEYAQALVLSRANGLRLNTFRAHYNLAEAHYTRFRDGGNVTDEAAGDVHVQAALAAPVSDSSPAAVEAARRLKAELLGRTQAVEPNRLLPGERAVHVAEMAEIEQQRLQLAVPGEPPAHAAAHLAIARAYLVIANREREAASALIERYGLQARFTAQLAALRQAFERELTREQRLDAVWKQAAGDLLDDTRRPSLIAHLLREGAVNKSGYGALCGVAPATASKHLGLLAERALLVQRGKGPSTRYELPAG